MPPREPQVSIVTGSPFENKHLTQKMTCARKYIIGAPFPRDPDKNVEDMGAVALALEGIISAAIQAGVSLRAAGGAWSLSNVAFPDDWLLDTLSLNLKWRMKRTQVRLDYTGDFDKLYLFQCGNSIDEINRRLESDGNSLSTCGASNGQTIAGAVSTGTHGSAFLYGSMTKYVAGIHLVAGPENTVWLEPASKPVVTDAFVATIGARLIQDDEMFNAVLVSFGSFGIIAGILITSEAKYELECKRQRIRLEDGLRDAMNSLQLDHLALPHPERQPWHFEVTFNPHDIEGGGYVRTMYKSVFDATRPPNPPIPNGGLGPGEGLLSVISSISNVGNAAEVAAIVGLLVNTNLTLDNPGNPPFTGACSEVFTTTFLRGKAMSMELGIALENSTKVLDIICGLHPEVDVYAGVVSYRWVKQGPELLGWTKFPVTATIEFNAAFNSRTMDFYRRLWQELLAQGIDFTLHWGQMSELAPELLHKMYGDKVDRWKECRARLMTPESRAVFTNKFMRQCGLD